jgi:GAF domain-containing protein
MSFTLPTNHALTQRQIELSRNVAERLGAALESSRLFEQSQAQADRERQASETTSHLLGVTDVQTVLDLAAADFQEALGAVYTRVYLNIDTPNEARATREAS